MKLVEYRGIEVPLGPPMFLDAGRTQRSLPCDQSGSQKNGKRDGGKASIGIDDVRTPYRSLRASVRAQQSALDRKDLTEAQSHRDSEL